MTLHHLAFSIGEAVRAFISFVYGVVVLLLLLGAMLWLSSHAGAHEWYPASCCSGGDCGPIDSARVERIGVDYFIDHRWRVSRSSATPSPDGRFHGCWPDKNKPPVCFYAPPDGM